MASGKGKSITGIVLAWIIAIILILSGLGKVFKTNILVQEFTKWGLIDFILIIGIVEIVFAVLFVISRTASIGAFLLSAFLGGAVAVHLGNGETPQAFIPAILLLMVWVTAKLRNLNIFS